MYINECVNYVHLVSKQQPNSYLYDLPYAKYYKDQPRPHEAE